MILIAFLYAILHYFIYSRRNILRCFQGHCFIAVDPNCFAPGFDMRLTDLIQQMRGLEKVMSTLITQYVLAWVHIILYLVHTSLHIHLIVDLSQCRLSELFLLCTICITLNFHCRYKIG